MSIYEVFRFFCIALMCAGISTIANYLLRNVKDRWYITALFLVVSLALGVVIANFEIILEVLK